MTQHIRGITPGDPGTLVVTCPECGQLEMWTFRELEDHGQCRSITQPCELCQEREADE